MPEVVFNDVYQWKNSSHKVSSVGAGFKFSTVNEDMHRDVDRVHDRIEQLFEPDVRENDIKDQVHMYSDHFDTGITIEHRKHIRALADGLVDRASTLAEEYNEQDEDILNQERRLLAQKLCETRTELDWIAGSTRNCFSAQVIAKGMTDNAYQFAQLGAKLRNDAITAESEAQFNAHDRAFNAYIKGDEADYNKFLGMLTILKGGWHKLDFTDEVDEDLSRTVTELTFTLQWNRTAGSISDATGTYDGDIAAIDAAGGAALNPN